VLGLVAFFDPRVAFAACSGADRAWTCTAGSTRAQVQAVIDVAEDEAVVTFAAGSYDWTGGVINLGAIDGVTLRCETVGTCLVAHDGNLVYKDFVPAASDRLHRITGFSFTGTSGTGTIWFLGQNDLTRIRIDHNTFTETSGSGCKVAVFFGAIDPGFDGNMFGVVDNNTFTSTSSWNHMGVKNLSGQDAAWTLGLPGSARNLFIEDNVFTYSALNYNGGCGCMDAWNGGATVFRFNTTTNCRVVSHGVCHGGPPNFEVYHNDITTPDGYRNIHHQGSGEMFVFHNDLNNGNEIALLHYRSCPPEQTGCSMPRCDGSQPIDGNRLPTSTYYGYPCYRQPGRDASGTLRPIFAWDNVHDGGKSDIDFQDAWGCTNPSPHDHVQADRDYYNAVSAQAQISPTSPFDGTTGMGFGSLANRPPTCTTTSEAADAGHGGVGYWATDVGNWNGGAGAEQGRLYLCSSEDTWTEYYEPYRYPHPLRGVLLIDGFESGDTSAWSATVPWEQSESTRRLQPARVWRGATAPLSGSDRWEERS
jgi:hypothetical protein